VIDREKTILVPAEKTRIYPYMGNCPVVPGTEL
jgi:hypothetical protein